MSNVTAKAMSWTEAGLVPDAVIRAGIRRLHDRRCREIHAGDVEVSSATLNDFVDMMNESPVALVPELANEQHYEVPAEFFNLVMGEHRKYSCCYWSESVTTLTEAEAEALEMTALRAGIADGMKVLDMGCGWGSFSLWAAARFPNGSFTAVSNSNSQREYITAQAEERGISNLRVITCDMNDFAADGRFDRIVSIEMFEHMRNWGELFRRVSQWLRDDGRFFMHVFCHRTTPYQYIDRGPSDWMSRHFFSGGIMPSADLALRFPQHLVIDRRWHWNGVHYAKTCNAWLETMDSNKAEIMPILKATYGDDNASLWWQRWRMFFMACAELFDFNKGNEWYIGHYRFKRGDV